MESFSSLPDHISWSHINGGMITSRCGVMAAGTAMHMKGASTGDDICHSHGIHYCKTLWVNKSKS